MKNFMEHIGGSPGRSGHRLSIEAARIVFEARERLASLFNVSDPLRIVLTRNATEGLNIAIFGLLRQGDHVITSSMEHNSVMRPLRVMEARGVDLTVIPGSGEGIINPAQITRAIKKNTKAIFITHASNITGTILPVAEIGHIARTHDLILCVDAAQTAGSFPIDVEKMNITKDGKLKTFLTNGVSIIGKDGTVKGYRGVSKDITERKKIDKFNEKLLEVLDNSWDEIFIFEIKSLRLIYVNKQALEHSGYTRDELSGMILSDISGYTQEEIHIYIKPLLDGEKESIILKSHAGRKPLYYKDRSTWSELPPGHW
jgi:PAS domain-containing protein